VEVKGRTFHGTSLSGLKGLDGWVTFEDVQGLSELAGAFAAQKNAGTGGVCVYLPA